MNFPGVAARLGWHEVGRAIDFVRGQANMGAIEQAMADAGFTNGRMFRPPDAGHFQLPSGVLTRSAADACTAEHPNGT
jgi:hypothetical protein